MFNTAIQSLFVFTGLAVFTCLAASASAQPSRSGLVPTPEVDLAFEVFGQPAEATPVIAVNGGPGLSHAYMLQNDVWQRIARHRQVVFYDQRGTGKSTRLSVGAPQTMAAQVADLEAVRLRLNLPSIDLVGDSYGGLVCLAYISAHPDRVRRLVLSDTLASWDSIVHLLPQVYPDIQEEDAADQKRLGDTPAAAQASLLNHFRMIFYSPELRDRYLAGFHDMGYTPATGTALEKATSRLDLTPQLPRIKAPTLVITGRFDMNVAPLTAWRMYKAIPGSQLRIFEKSGHLPSYEEPELYVRVIEDFLSGTR